MLDTIKRTPRFLMIMVFFALAGCASTEPDTAEAECRPADSQSCSEDTGDDRGYDPCLINKNLPVCKG